ncbi:MAG: histidine--tRNA ligase [Candidatus Saccharimonadales bacterium]
MALSTQPYKGARDFYPEDKQLQKYMFNIMRTVCERYGYEEYDAPILEPTELFASKTSDEIVNEQTYSFVDRGARNVTIRTEMTPSVSRMVAARRQELSYPLRWYSIPNIWRYERPQRGRGREFFQLNVDIFGVGSIAADHEIIMVADSIMQQFKAQRNMYVIKINSRLLVNALLHDVLQVDDTQAQIMIRLIDRMHKMDQTEFAGKLDAIFSPSQREAGKPDLLLNFLSMNTLDEIFDDLKTLAATETIQKLMRLLKQSGITNVMFDPTLMRGFDYYTDIVFEVFDTFIDNNRAMFGGGRYDGLVGLFGVEPVPTVGFGMGDITLLNFLQTHKLLPTLVPDIDTYVVLIGDVYAEAQPMIQELREMGLRVAVDSSGRKADKQLKSALKRPVQYILFVGEKEIADQQFVMKNITTKSEERHSAQRVVTLIKDYRTI